MKAKAVPLIFFSLFCICGDAQNSVPQKKKDSQFWFSFESHAALSAHDDVLLGNGFSAAMIFNQTNYLKVKVYGAGTMSGFPLGESREDILRSIENISFFFGRATWQGKGLFSAAIGLSCGKGIYQGDLLYMKHNGGWWSFDVPVYDLSSFTYWGVPVEFGMMGCGRFMGIGINVWANLHEHADCGFSVFYSIGKIRYQKVEK